ncbi:MAG TPA: hypothetical protein VMC85_06030 [Desulfomonilaceae bacterium]|nr:hypothetical protein [Desulfomonilaceae bacterium]
MGYYLHAVPGRLRIKIPLLKRNPERAMELRKLLRRVAGITSTSTSTVTGSVTINYDRDIVRPNSILNLLAHENYIDLGEAISGYKPAEAVVSNVGKTVSKALLSLALERALQGSSLSFITAFL